VKIKHYEIKHVKKRGKENTQELIAAFTGTSGIENAGIVRR